MRKLFSILAVAMTAISLHATVVTKNPDMSQFGPNGKATVSGGTITNAAAWNGAQSWEWLEGISAYDQIVIALEDHAQTVLFKVIYSDESSMQVELPTGTNTEVINLDPVQNIVKGIQVLNWSIESGIDITITDLFFRGAIGIKKNITIWSGSKAFDNFDWDNRLLMNAEDFADLHVGDILEVYYSTNAESYHQFDVKTNYDNNYPSFAPAQTYTILTLILYHAHVQITRKTASTRDTVYMESSVFHKLKGFHNKLRRFNPGQSLFFKFALADKPNRAQICAGLRHLGGKLCFRHEVAYIVDSEGVIQQKQSFRSSYTLVCVKYFVFIFLPIHDRRHDIAFHPVGNISVVTQPG